MCAGDRPQPDAPVQGPASFPGVQVVANRHRRGLAGARNTGIECSRGEVVAFLDDDAVADRSWLEALVMPYTDPTINGTGGVARALGRGSPAVGSRRVRLGGRLQLPGPPGDRALRSAIRLVHRCPSGGLCFPMSGGFDIEMGRVAAVPLGCEETVVGIRVLQRYGPGTILHVPAATVDHRVGPERASVRYLVKRCFSEGISKAAVARLVGTNDGSSAERAYVTNVLPRGVASGLAQFLSGDPSGASRSS